MIFEKDQSMVFRKIEDETILVPIKNNVGELANIYVLNEVGAKVWELIDGKSDIEDISSAVCKEFEITTEEAKKDIKDFLEGLESVGAVRPVPETGK